VPAAIASVTAAALAPGGGAAGIATDPLTLQPTASVRPESPAPLRQADVVSLIERPG
jgi:hypothetical protein